MNSFSKFSIIIILFLQVILLISCSKKESTGSNNHFKTDEAPTSWNPFLDWAEEELLSKPPVQPLPEESIMESPKYPIYRFDENLNEAEIVCNWSRNPLGRGEILEIGPFESNSPHDGFLVKVKQDSKEPGVSMKLSGFQLNREEIGKIVIIIEQPFGLDFDLIWDERGGKLRIPVKDPLNPWEVTLDTEGFGYWKGELNELEIVANGSNTENVVIHSIRFFKVEDPFPEPVGARRLEVNREIRDTLYLHGRASITYYDLAIPTDAVLQMGVAVIPGKLGSKNNQLNITVISEGFETLLDQMVIETGTSWQEVKMSLDPWVGKSISIRIDTFSESESLIFCLGNPILFESQKKPPIYIFYLIDTLSSAHIDLYGYHRETMPRLKELAQRGVWFSKMFSNATVTPESVPNILFSLTLDRLGFYIESESANTDLISLSESLRSAGYLTALYSTNINVGPMLKLDQGFDHFFNRFGSLSSETDDLTVPIEEVLEWLNNHDDRPIFLYIHTAEPHTPYAPKEGFKGRFAKLKKLRSQDSRFSWFTSEVSEKNAEWAEWIDLYDEEIYYSDHRLGLFMDALEQQGYLGRSTFIVTSDHGEAFGDHGGLSHGSNLHYEVHRIPLVIAGPQISERGVSETPAQLYDIMPTLLELLGVQEPYPLAGNSLLPLLSILNKKNTTKVNQLNQRPIFATNHASRGPIGIIEYVILNQGRWKLIGRPRLSKSSTDWLPRFSLYDLNRDYREKKNLLEKNKKLSRELIETLVEWRKTQAPIEEQGQGASFDKVQLNLLKKLGYIR